MNIKVFLLSTLFFFAVSTTIYSEPIDPPFPDKTFADLNYDERLILADNSSDSPTVTGDRDEKAQKDYSFSVGEKAKTGVEFSAQTPTYSPDILLILFGL